jgi:hypothetical protein
LWWTSVRSREERVLGDVLHTWASYTFAMHQPLSARDRPSHVAQRRVAGGGGALDDTEFAPTRRGFRMRSTSFEIRLPKRYLSGSAELPMSPQRRFQESLQVRGANPLVHTGVQPG